MSNIYYESCIKVNLEQLICNYLDIDANIDVFCLSTEKGKDKFFFSLIAIRVSREGIGIIETGCCQSSYKI